MVDSSVILLAELAVLGIAYTWLSYLEAKVANLDEVKPFLKSKALSVGLLALGVVVHTFGDAFGYELQLETAGHIIILIGSVILIKQTLDLWKVVEAFGNG